MKDYKCSVCGWQPKENEISYDNYAWEHCPNCLCGMHELTEDDLDCGGTLKPIAIWVDKQDDWRIIQRCSLCGEIHDSKASADDSPIKLMSIASMPLARPPFPLEKIEELTLMMGGRGSTEGFYHE